MISDLVKGWSKGNFARVILRQFAVKNAGNWDEYSEFDKIFSEAKYRLDFS